MFSVSTYKERRKKLSSLVKQGVILLLGNNESPMNYPANTYSFRQDSTFLYFVGLDIPEIAVMIDIDNQKTTLYGNDVGIEDIIWTGTLPSMSERASLTGIENVKPFSELEKDVKKAMASKQTVHFTPPYRHDNMILLSDMLNIPINNLKTVASMELIRAIVMLRSIKDKDEIAHLDDIQQYGYEMHVTAMKMAQEGMHEQKIAGIIEGIALQYGARVSFPTILSKHGEIFHNHHHNHILKKGDLMLCDAGFESNLGYATDHTRTTPVGGTFTQQQREIYEIVLSAKNKAFEMAKPGVYYRDIHLQASKVIAEGLKALGLMKGDVNEAVDAGAHALFFPHGLGHMMGLDVHDMEDLGENHIGYDTTIQRSDQFGLSYVRMARKLQAGFVITDEPGIYFIPELIELWKSEHKLENFINYSKLESYLTFGGIRLEDDVLITDTGSRLLGEKRIPITVDEVYHTVTK